jgi:hypothetical protein
VLSDIGAVCVAMDSVTCLNNKWNRRWTEEWYVHRKSRKSKSITIDLKLRGPNNYKMVFDCIV